jgi:hypothetical protein
MRIGLSCLRFYRKLVVATLEGAYCLEATVESSSERVRPLLGDTTLTVKEVRPFMSTWKATPHAVIQT